MDSSIKNLLQRVKDGDQAAAAELVDRYEPVVRREIRLWLRRYNTIAFSRLVDSTDICQSVLARFFVAASEGSVDVQSHEHLKNLLLIMSKHRFMHHVRSNRALRRDIYRTTSMPTGAMNQLPESSNREMPDDAVVENELLQMIRGRLTPEERELAERRARGESWADVVKEMGGTVDGRRVQLARAEARVAAEFGLGSKQSKG